MERPILHRQGGGEAKPVDIEGLCLLSLDGGGVRGLSTLYILKGVMDRLNHERQADKLSVVKPCEIFDLIGGTSTGGLIAIMLGRLEMDVDQCIAAYSTLAESVFGGKLRTLPVGFRGQVEPQFDSKKLKDAILKIIDESGSRESDLLNDGQNRGCRTFVCAADRHTKNTVRIRSYKLPHEPEVRATIWQAALATSAATTFFDAASIGNRSFADGGLGANNPVDEVEGEASNIWCHDTGDLKPMVKCFVSIGTGNPGINPFEEKLYGFLTKTVVDIATETERTERNFLARWAKHYDEQRYFRFNVEQGLQDIGLAEYKKKGAMEAATDGYLTHRQQQFRVRDCVRNLRMKQNKAKDTFALDLQAFIDRTARQQTSTKTYYEVPAAALSSFSGRQAILRHIREVSSNNVDWMNSPPPVVVLHAMGGQGKSYIALEYCRDSRFRYRGVFWINASSTDTVQRGFESLAQSLDPSTAATLDSPEKKVRLVLDTLAAWEQAWLLVFDNYDQPYKLSMTPYLPSHGNGLCIITSRREESRSYARPGIENALQVPSMEFDGGLELLEHRLGLSSKDDEGNLARSKLLQRLGGLALAIDQAAAYIWFHKLSISEFLRRYEGEREKILQHHRESAWDYNKFGNDAENETAVTAYTTWEMTFKQVAPSDQPLEQRITRFLHVSAFLQPLRIGEHVFREYFKVQPNTFAWLVLFTSSIDGGDSDDDGPVMRSDNQEPDSRRHWDCGAFWQVVRDLERLSLVDNTGRYPEDTGAWFSIHPVIRDWLQIRMKSPMRKEVFEESMRIVGAAVGTEFAKVTSFEVKQELLNHVDLVADFLRSMKASDVADVTMMGHEPVALGSFYKLNGQFVKAVELLKRVVEAREDKLDEDNPDRLASQHALAIAHRVNGQIEAAVDLLKHVVSIRDTSLAEDDSDRLASQHALAIAYVTANQPKLAVKLLKHIIEVWNAKFEENHPSLLASQHELGIALRKTRQMSDAVVLLEHVVRCWKATRAENHPHRLASQHALAITYRANGQVRESVELFERIVKVKGDHLAENNHSLLASQHELAITYLADRQITNSVNLQEHVVKIWETDVELGETHPDRLVAQHELALAYRADGRFKDAIELLEHVVSVRQTSLTKNHPERLASQRDLAIMHLLDGRIGGAVDLLKHVANRVMDVDLTHGRLVISFACLIVALLLGQLSS